MNTEFKLYEICAQQMYRTFELEALILQVREQWDNQVTDDSCRLQGREECCGWQELSEVDSRIQACSAVLEGSWPAGSLYPSSLPSLKITWWRCTAELYFYFLFPTSLEWFHSDFSQIRKNMDFLFKEWRCVSTVPFYKSPMPVLKGKPKGLPKHFHLSFSGADLLRCHCSKSQ